jgi:hypothetical protein
VAVLLGLHAATTSAGSTLYVNPALPAWMPALTIRNLRAGRGALSLRFADGSVEVLENTTGFEVVHRAAPGPFGSRATTLPGEAEATAPASVP